MTQAPAIATPTTDLIHDDELHLHVEDDLSVNAIRDGKLVQMYWSQLTEDEQRSANVALFNLYIY